MASTNDRVLSVIERWRAGLITTDSCNRLLAELTRDTVIAIRNSNIAYQLTLEE